MNGNYLRSRSTGRLAVFFTVASIAVLVDQATKAAIRYLLPVGSPARVLIPGVMDLWHIQNTGAAFSLGQGASPLFFVLLVLVVLIATLVLVAKERLPLFLVASLACVAGGGIGNMVDRLACGSVTDFLALSFIDFPVFNVADIFVTCGVIATFVGYLLWDARREKAETLTDANR
ncbi:MAG: signal peptidase II [Atopobiaceae bacterium]|nr:signal peptidase II [Atopobiaceae bacterium]